jgi:hypothetical protein
MNNIYYVYQYLSPLTGDPFYIGMGHGNRKDYHLKEAEKYLANKLNKKSRNLLKINTIVKLLRANILPIITIIEEHLTKEEASCLEQTLIEHYGRIDLQTGVLTNMTPGGVGIQSWSPAQKRAISNLKKGKSIYYDKTLSKLRLVSKTEYLSNKDNFIARNTYLKTNTNINNNLTNYIQAKHILTEEEWLDSLHGKDGETPDLATSLLTGLTETSAADIEATDPVLAAFAKLQAQIKALELRVATLENPPAP